MAKERPPPSKRPRTHQHANGGPKSAAAQPPPEPAPEQAAVDVEEAFPRGGANTLTPLERRQVEVDAREELERELASGQQPKAKKAKRAVGKVCMHDADASRRVLRCFAAGGCARRACLRFIIITRMMPKPGIVSHGQQPACKA